MSSSLEDLLGQRAARDYPLTPLQQAKIDAMLTGLVASGADLEQMMAELGAFMKSDPEILEVFTKRGLDAMLASGLLERGCAYDAATDTWYAPDGESR